MTQKANEKHAKSRTWVFPALFAFGTAYNALIGYMERKKYLDGYTAYAVAFGSIVTLGGVALVDIRAATLALIAFIASGAPMIAGATWRYIKARESEMQYERQAAALAALRGKRER